MIQRAWRSSWRRRQLRCAATAVRWHAAAVVIQARARGWLYRRDWTAKLLRLLRRLCRRLTGEVGELRMALRRGEALAAEQSAIQDRLMRRTLANWGIGQRFRRWAAHTAKQARARLLQNRIAGRLGNRAVGMAFAAWVEMVEAVVTRRTALADAEREQAAQQTRAQLKSAREQLAGAEQQRAAAEARAEAAEAQRLTAEEKVLEAQQLAESERWMKRDGWARAGQRAYAPSLSIATIVC